MYRENKMITLVIENKKYKVKCSGKGVYGSYFKLNKTRGIKVFTHLKKKDPNEIINKKSFRMVKKEFKNQNMIYKKLPHFVPKAFKVVIVQISPKYYAPAIIMSHVEGKPLYKTIPKRKQAIMVGNKIKHISLYERGLPVEKFLANKLKSVGFRHGDLHLNNIILTQNHKLKMIDFRFSKRI